MSKQEAHSDAAHAAIGKALGRVPSGLFILTASDGDVLPAAMLASWVQQAGFNPPMVCVAMAKDRPIRGVVERSRQFALSQLAQGDSALLKRYARGIPPGVDPFEGVLTATTPGGQPVLADALAWLDCRLTRVCEFGGDHDLLVAEVTAGAVLKDAPPFTHVRGSGFHY